MFDAPDSPPIPVAIVFCILMARAAFDLLGILSPATLGHSNRSAAFWSAIRRMVSAPLIAGAVWFLLNFGHHLRENVGKTSETVAPAVRSADAAVIGNSDAFWCQHRASLEALGKYHGQEDRDAFRHYLVAAYQSGECTDIADGTKVFIMEPGGWSRMAKVRREGQVREWWIMDRTLKSE